MTSDYTHPPADAGLCRSCAHVQTITSTRQSTFYLCRRSVTDPSFPKYPRLPVLECRGYERRDVPPRDQT